MEDASVFTLADVFDILRALGERDPETALVTVLATADSTGLDAGTTVRLRACLG